MTEPQAISENQRGEIVLTDHMHQLTTGGGKPGQGYPAVLEPQTATQVRRLTPVECERLMGWPDDHTRYRADGTEVADSHRYRMCGNGVASPVAEWVAGRINAAIADEVTP
jgi:DNA (cytosine-5)-methyltransferase 1